jgi:Tfp pilus assembly protein FimT
MKISATYSIVERARATNLRRRASYGTSGPQHEAASILRCSSRRARQPHGFSILELVMVAAIFLVVCAMSIPSVVKMLQSYQAASNSRSLASDLALAKMDAARNFTQTQVSCNLAGNSCQVQICTAKGAITCNTFAPEGGPVLLSQGTTFGFGSISVPAGTQTIIQNTAQIVFNSRGIPVDNTGTPTANDALYLIGQGVGTYAVTVNATGKISVWRYYNGAWRSL